MIILLSPIIFSNDLVLPNSEHDPWFRVNGGKLNGNNTWTGINTFHNYTIINYEILNITGDIIANDFCYSNGTCLTQGLTYEADTLQSVTDRDSVTTNNITISGGMLKLYNPNNARLLQIYQEGAWNDSVFDTNNQFSFKTDGVARVSIDDNSLDTYAVDVNVDGNVDINSGTTDIGLDIQSTDLNSDIYLTDSTGSSRIRNANEQLKFYPGDNGSTLTLEKDGDVDIVQGNLFSSAQSKVRIIDQFNIHSANFQLGLYDTDTGATEWCLTTYADNDLGFYGNNCGTLRTLMKDAGDIYMTVDNTKFCQGASQDSCLYYNASDWIFNPDEIGDGSLIIDGNAEVTDNLYVGVILNTTNLCLNNSCITSWDELNISGGGITANSTVEGYINLTSKLIQDKLVNSSITYNNDSLVSNVYDIYNTYDVNSTIEYDNDSLISNMTVVDSIEGTRVAIFNYDNDSNLISVTYE